jgi:ribosomal protein S25
MEPKGSTPQEKIRAETIELDHWKDSLRKEKDEDWRDIMQRAVEVSEQVIDNLNLEMGSVPESEEGRRRY